MSSSMSSSSHESTNSISISTSTLILPSGHRFRTRQPLTSYLNYNETTNLWIITINTNQKHKSTSGNDDNDDNNDNDTQTPNSIHLKAFSFSSEHAAREMAHVYAPPKLLSLKGQSHCFNCDAKFQSLSIQKRPCHCRNCGVLICRTCMVRWHKFMIPDTYRYNRYSHKNNSSSKQRRRHSQYVKVCKTCEYLSIAFKHALLDGNYEHASSLYRAGNINLRCPIMNVRKGNEIMLPIHYAVIGGSLKILSWLIDVHYCPIKIITTGGGGNGGRGGVFVGTRRRNTRRTQELIQTSQGRNILDLAIAHRRVNILHYLVNQKRISISSSSTSTSNATGGGAGGKDKRKKKASMDSSMALEAALKAYPLQRTLASSTSRSSGVRVNVRTPSNPSLTVKQRLGTKNVQEGSSYLFNICTSSFNDDDDDDEDFDSDYYLSDDDYEERNPAQQHTDDEESVVTTKQYPCIICYEKNIDCVLTPCGHQICCIGCSRNMPKCPICTAACTGVRIFRP